jgi:hypothetical protein
VSSKEHSSKPSKMPMTDEEFCAALLAPQPTRDSAAALPNNDARLRYLDDLLSRALLPAR